MYRRKFDNLNRKLALKKEKALDAARKSQIEFYVKAYQKSPNGILC